MLSLRTLAEKDIPLLTEICRLGMEYDVWYEDLLKQKTIQAKDYQSELGLVAEIDGEPAGFVQGVMGKRRDETFGWIRLLAVHPKFRCQSVGTTLLKEIEKRLEAQGAAGVSIMDVAANYQMPGVDFRYKEAFCFLIKNGYERGIPNHNLICDVRPDMADPFLADIERLKGEDFTIRCAQQSDWDSLVKFLKANWPAWVDEAAGAYDNDPITLYICIHKGEVVGFSGYEGNNRGMGWFGPMGVDPVTRGKKIGAFILLLCLRDLALMGHRKAIIPWVGPIRFYDKICQAKIERIFWTFTKRLKKG